MKLGEIRGSNTSEKGKQEFSIKSQVKLSIQIIQQFYILLQPKLYNTTYQVKP